MLQDLVNHMLQDLVNRVPRPSGPRTFTSQLGVKGSRAGRLAGANAIFPAEDAADEARPLMRNRPPPTEMATTWLWGRGGALSGERQWLLRSPLRRVEL